MFNFIILTPCTNLQNKIEKKNKTFDSLTLFLNFFINIRHK